MKYAVLLMTIFLVGYTGSAQKKKGTTPTTKTAATSSAKLDNITAEVKGKTLQLVITGKGKAPESILVKEMTPEVTPTAVKLTSFMASGTKLYQLQWTEKTSIKTELKTEDSATIHSLVYEMSTKRQVFSNWQRTTEITEKVFLDKNNTASETQQKIRKEGFELLVNPDGTLTQKSKTQQHHWVYDAVKLEFADAKKK